MSELGRKTDRLMKALKGKQMPEQRREQLPSQRQISTKDATRFRIEDDTAKGEREGIKQFVRENIGAITEPYEYMIQSFIVDTLRLEEIKRRAINDVADEENSSLRDKRVFWSKDKHMQKKSAFEKIEVDSPYRKFYLDCERIRNEDEERIIPIGYNDQQLKLVFNEQGQISQVAVSIMITKDGVVLPEETPTLSAFAQDYFLPAGRGISDYTGVITLDLDDPELPKIRMLQRGYSKRKTYSQEPAYAESLTAAGSYDFENEAFVVKKLSPTIPMEQRRQTVPMEQFFSVLTDCLTLISQQI